MKLQTQRFIDRWAGQLLCGVVSGWVRFTELFGAPARLGKAPKNILVILLSEMGSIVLAGPMFAALRRQYPGAAIHILQLKKNQEVSKLLSLTEVVHMHTLDDSSGGSLIGDILTVSLKMRRLGLDAVIDCELFSRVSALLSFSTGAAVRVGFTPHTQEGLYRGSFINHSIPYNPYQHISKQFLSLVDALQSPTSMPRNRAGAIREIPGDPELSVNFTPEELAAYRGQVEADHPVTKTRQLVLVYAGGGILPERAWPASHYDACIDLTGYTKSIRELLMLMYASSLLITNDGGPSHFATVTPIQTMVFFGPETGKLYGPLGKRTIILESGIACSPCLTAYNHRLTFCDGDNQCLKRIAPDPVLEQALAFLRDNGADNPQGPTGVVA